jgi:cytochrome c oxidase assembly protein subunit 15
VEQVDFDRIDLERFRQKAERLGRDPAAITEESLRSEFNPVHTWIEFLNRLFALPVGFLTLATFVASFWQRGRRPAVFWASAAALFVVLLNAWLGARVVFSGLQPGIITLHMALAILLVCLLVFAAWRGRERPWVIGIRGNPRPLRMIGWGLLGLVIVEGVIGSQVRELTDELAKSHAGAERAEWTAELEGSAKYLVHRSFSWLIVVGTGLFLVAGSKRLVNRLGWLEKSIAGMVFALMVMGVILAHVGVLRVVQVLHVGVAALLVAALYLWLLASRGVRS